MGALRQGGARRDYWEGRTGFYSFFAKATLIHVRSTAMKAKFTNGVSR
jgi:hypothetical protein